MLTRRALLRSALLAGLGAAVPSLAACGTAGSGRSDAGHDLAPGAPGSRYAVSDVAREPGSAADSAAAAAAVRDFTADLYRELAGGSAGQSGRNVVCSPYSVAVALAMTANGARGRTAEEMAAVLHSRPPHLDGRLNRGLGGLDATLESRAGKLRRRDGTRGTVVLDTANALWGQAGTAWRPEFLDALAAGYGAGMRMVDYVTAADAARQEINGWTAKQTHDRITDLVPEGALDALTRLVLVNAVYLTAPWEEPFDKAATTEGSFRTADGRQVRVPMMAGRLDQGGYAAGPGWRAARLSYVGGQLAMAVVVPDGSLTELERSLDGDALTGLLAGLEPVPALELRMPRWRFRTEASLVDPLAALGMPTAFTDRADFTGITAEEPLLVDDVLHQAYVAVDEAGTEAAAATAVEVGLTSAPARVAELVADRAFLFVLHDVPTGTPLFVGRVADPTA